MDVRDVAKRALREFTDVQESPGFNKLNSTALQGYFRGVSEGNITVGQAWVGDILRAGNSGHSSQEVSLAQFFLVSKMEIFEEIFASGMCCEGQTLGGERAKTFAERS